jgi:hypothetical protein
MGAKYLSSSSGEVILSILEYVEPQELVLYAAPPAVLGLVLELNSPLVEELA